MPRRRLLRSGMRIGRDHVASTVNTLVLAYAGASMPLLILFVLSDQPMGTVANGEIVATEIVRTLVGSLGLIASVPITTWLAVHVVARRAGRPPATRPDRTPRTWGRRSTRSRSTGAIQWRQELRTWRSDRRLLGCSGNDEVLGPVGLRAGRHLSCGLSQPGAAPTGDVTLTRTSQADEHAVPPPPARSSRLGSWWAIVGFALVLLLALGWRFIADPSLSAPTRDPAWYTWRAGVILEDDPGSVAGDWGPDNLFSGGYRVTVPLAGALLQRVSGISTYSFSAFLMLGIPSSPAWRSVRVPSGAGRPAVVLLTMLATAGLFLTTPYVGYLDNITVLFLLCLIVAFADAARTSWGARLAIFMIGMAAAFTHPTTCVLFGVSLMGVWATHLVTSRFRLGSAMRTDGPLLLSTGFGMVAGLALWVVGIWGPGGPELLKDAALPPPYTAEFFRDRLVEWVTSMQPAITFPLVAGRDRLDDHRSLGRTRTPATQYEQVSIWWMFPFAGVLTFLLGQAIPYYRFMNATAAPMALTGLGAFVAVRWLYRGEGDAKYRGRSRRAGRGRCARLRVHRSRGEPLGPAGQPVGAAEHPDVVGGRPRGRGGRRRTPARLDRELRERR